MEKKINKRLLNNRVRTEANTVLQQTFNDMKESFPDVFITLRPEETQDDMGVDFSVELVYIRETRSFQRFCIQNKGSSKAITELKSRPGYFSFSLNLRNARYYLHELNVPLIFAVVDLVSRAVYWHAIQLDEDIEQKMEEAAKSAKGSLTFYIPLANKLTPDTFSRFVADTFNSYKEQFYRFQKNKTDDPFKNASGLVLDTASGIDQQFRQLIDYYFADLNYLPPKWWLSHKFFNKRGEAYWPDEPFLLTTDNETLYEFLKKANEESDSLLQFFLRHHLSTIRLTKGRNEFQISQTYKEPDNYVVRFNSLRWSECFTYIDGTSTDSFQKAYVAYLLGELPAAYTINGKIFQEERKKHNRFTPIIASHNLGVLKKSIVHYYYPSKPILEKLIPKELPDTDALARKSDLDPQSVKQLKDQEIIKFLSDFITDRSNNIINNYFATLRGTVSSNNTALTVRAAYADLCEFLDQNFICYNHFLEFNLLSEMFCEAMLAALAIPSSSSHLSHINDWILITMILHGNPESIRNNYHKYSHYTLAYQSGKDEQERFDVFFCRFLDDYSSLVEVTSKRDENNMRLFWERHDNILANLFLFFAVLELPDEMIRPCINALEQFLCVQTRMHLRIYSYLKPVFDFRKKYISKKTAITLLRHFTSLPRYQDDSLIEAVVVCLDKDDLTNEEEKEIAGLLLNYARELHTKENRAGDPEIPVIQLFSILRDTSIKEEITALIKERLASSFDNTVYYLATSYRVIDYNTDNLFNTYSRYIKDHFKPHFFDRHGVGGRTFHTSFLDAYLDLSFQDFVTPDAEMLGWIASLGPFYRWLIEMDNFDFSLFQPDWITMSHPSSFQKRIVGSAKTKTALQEYLKKNKDPRVEKAVIRQIFLQERF